jgi:hypothetical protein
MLFANRVFDDANRCTTPPDEEAKYEGDDNTFFQTGFFKSGLSLYDLGRNPPMRLKRGLMPRLSTVGIAVL